MPYKDPEKARQYHREYIKRYLADPEKRALVNKRAKEQGRRVKDWINEYKVKRGCVDCGYNKHPAALDIDHMEGKTANISSLKSIRAVREEIRRHKCVVRCANCHRIKSFETKTWIREVADE